jgi:dipeptidyl-peptidase III
MSIFNEIYVKRVEAGPEFAALSDVERKFIYYVFRAGLPFAKIFRDQHHRFTNVIIELMEIIYLGTADNALKSDVETYLVYLYTNNGPYFLAEQGVKRTPGAIGLTHLTYETTYMMLARWGHKLSGRARSFWNLYRDEILAVIFDPEVDPVLVIDGSIESSGGNFYERGFTEQMYMSMPESVRSGLATRFELDSDKAPVAVPYSIHYAEYLETAISWLRSARNLIEANPKYFDEHMLTGMNSLIEYFRTGDEELFKDHCRAWIKQGTKNVDYTMGFIEQYHDPKQIRGHAGADVLVKLVDMSALTPILLEIEQRMNIAPEYKKRREDAKVLNASVAKKIFGCGDYGPICWTAAYCLPNYNDIRATDGSKQILYKTEPAISDVLNGPLARVFQSTAETAFLNTHDPEDQSGYKLWDVHVLLHETIGHGSGRAHKHLVLCDKVVSGVSYVAGDTIDVTEQNYSELIGSDAASLEELRADISALCISISEMDVLAAAGVYGEWYERLGPDLLKRRCMIEMASTYLGRIVAQPKGFTSITGAHSRCNAVITNWLIEARGIELASETKTHNGVTYTIYSIAVRDFNNAYHAAVGLMQEVQRIKSCADGDACAALFARYTNGPITIDTANKIRDDKDAIRKLLVGNIKSATRIYPNLMLDESGRVYVGADQSFIEQNIVYGRM